MTAALDKAIRAALEVVKDPCSVAAGAPLSLLEMGLVGNWRECGEGVVEVELDTTSPLCLMAGHMIEEAQEQLERIPGITQAIVRVRASGDWTPNRISENGRRKLRRARDEEAALTAR